MAFDLLKTFIAEREDNTLAPKELLSPLRSTLLMLYKGTFDPMELDDNNEKDAKKLSNLEELMAMGLVDEVYQFTDAGRSMVDKLGGRAVSREDRQLANHINAAHSKNAGSEYGEEMADTFDPDTDAFDDNFDNDYSWDDGEQNYQPPPSTRRKFAFTENEKILMKSIGLTPNKMEQIFEEAALKYDNWDDVDVDDDQLPNSGDTDECPDCSGVGFVNGEVCGQCNGEGVVFADREMYDPEVDPDQLYHDDNYNTPSMDGEWGEDQPIMADEPWDRNSDMGDPRNTYRESALDTLENRWKRVITEKPCEPCDADKKKPCTYCNGEGKLPKERSEDGQMVVKKVKCRDCNGTGKRG